MEDQLISLGEGKINENALTQRNLSVNGQGALTKFLDGRGSLTSSTPTPTGVQHCEPAPPATPQTTKSSPSLSRVQALLKALS